MTLSNDEIVKRFKDELAHSTGGSILDWSSPEGISKDQEYATAVAGHVLEEIEPARELFVQSLEEKFAGTDIEVNANTASEYAKLYASGLEKMINAQLESGGYAANPSPDGHTGLFVKIDALGNLITDYASLRTPEMAHDGMHTGIIVATNLLHYGVLGMKWGKRKDRPRSIDASEAERLRKQGRKQGVRSLTNAEIKRLNERKQLEKKYREMNPSTIKAGHAALLAGLALAGTGIKLYQTLNSPAAKEIRALGADLLKGTGSGLGDSVTSAIASSTLLDGLSVDFTDFLKDQSV